MSKYVNLPDTDDGDNGGVHINSGIPNQAFYLTSVGIGGYAWEAPAQIWYAALQASTPTTNFQEFADTTYLKAGQLYGSQSTEQQAVLSAWKEVGIRISGSSLAGTTARMRRQPVAAMSSGRDEDPAEGRPEDRATARASSRRSLCRSREPEKQAALAAGSAGPTRALPESGPPLTGWHESHSCPAWRSGGRHQFAARPLQVSRSRDAWTNPGRGTPGRACRRSCAPRLSRADSSGKAQDEMSFC